MAGEKNSIAMQTEFLIVLLLEAFDGYNRIIMIYPVTSEENAKTRKRSLKV
jgi:hypothetical protein